MLRRHLALWLTLTALLSSPVYGETYSFGVLNQRSATLTAQYWNPILDYVSSKTGVTLALKMGKDVAETYAMTGRGEFDFLYSNHTFTRENARAGYKVILRTNEDAIQGQIVVPEESALQNLEALREKEVGFPSKSAFVAYSVPMDHLLRLSITVKPAFGGNQEGVMAQLKTGTVVAAAVNSRVMRDYAERTGFRYRALWTSVDYLNLPVSVLPRVPADVAKRVQQVLDKMDDTPDGLAVLKASAQVIRQSPPYGFRAASDREYANYLNFYANTILKE